MPGASDTTLFLLLAGLLLASAAAAVAAWQLVGHLKRLDKHFERLQDLAALRASVERLAAAQPELDLRRLEHVLLDLRDATKRGEERLLALVESARAAPLAAGGLPVPSGLNAALLAERVVTRLLALGYERVQLVTPLADLEPLFAGEGAVAVEARRDGVGCKGRVLVKAGLIQDVQMQAAYSAFP